MKDTTLSGSLLKQNTKFFSFSRLKKEQVVEITVYFFIVLFTYSAFRKLVDYKMFVREVYGYTVVESVKWGIGLFSCLELLTAIILAFPKARLIGLIASFSLMIGLNTIGFIVLQKAPVIPYYFGGIFPTIDFFGHLALNLIILFIALTSMLKYMNLKTKKFS